MPQNRIECEEMVQRASFGLATMCDISTDGSHTPMYKLRESNENQTHLDTLRHIIDLALRSMRADCTPLVLRKGWQRGLQVNTKFAKERLQLDGSCWSLEVTVVGGQWIFELHGAAMRRISRQTCNAAIKSQRVLPSLSSDKLLVSRALGTVTMELSQNSESCEPKLIAAQRVKSVDVGASNTLDHVHETLRAYSPALWFRPWPWCVVNTDY